MKKKIAIARRNGLGDFISGTVPLCLYLHQRFNDCELHLFMDKSNSHLVKYFVPNAKIHTYSRINKYLACSIKALANRSSNFDIGIAPPPASNKLMGWFFWLLNTKESICTNSENKNPSLYEKAFFSKVYTPSREEHVGLQAIKSYFTDVKEIPEWCYPKFDKSLIPEYKFQHCNTHQKKLLIELSNHRSTSQLRLDALAKVLNELHTSFAFDVIITLMPKDLHSAESLQRKLLMTSEIALTPTLEDFISLVNGVDAFLLGDGGAAHIAGALEKPGVVLYGRTSITLWRVLSDKVHHMYDKDDVNKISTRDIKQQLLYCLKETGFKKRL